MENKNMLELARKLGFTSRLSKDGAAMEITLNLTSAGKA
jgi:hypothetical protein